MATYKKSSLWFSSLWCFATISSSGRRLTREGRRDLDRIASQINVKAKKAAAAAALAAAAHVE